MRHGALVRDGPHNLGERRELRLLRRRMSDLMLEGTVREKMPARWRISRGYSTKEHPWRRLKISCQLPRGRKGRLLQWCSLAAYPRSRERIERHGKKQDCRCEAQRRAAHLVRVLMRASSRGT